MSISLQPVERDTFDADDALSRYLRRFSGPPEVWVGRYAPDDEAVATERESLSDWRVWLRVESVRI